MDYDSIKLQAQNILNRHVFQTFTPSVGVAIEAEYRLWIKGLVKAGHLDDTYYYVDVKYFEPEKELSVFISDSGDDEPLTFIVSVQQELFEVAGL